MLLDEMVRVPPFLCAPEPGISDVLSEVSVGYLWNSASIHALSVIDTGWNEGNRGT
ncbi:MAG TPA: hypothetical protein VF374_00945 [Thermoplasmata archaeon]